MQQCMLKALVALLLVVGVLPSGVVKAAPPAQQNNCQYFAETGGFYVCDDAAARFRTAFQRWGLQNIGYPVSRRYERDGFVTQAFQKAIMQWRPESNSVALVNIFDDLHNAGFDEPLLKTRQTPNQLPAGWDGNAGFNEVVRKRQALLDVRPSLRRAYFAASDPLTFFGLPTSEVIDMGNHYAIRLQRAVLQEWKETVPWARAGEVTIANGGDIAKELGALPAAALTPESASAPPASPVPAQPAPTPAPTQTPPPAASGKLFSGQVLQAFTNCSITQVIGTVVDRAGNPVQGVRIRLWWPGGQFHTISGNYVRPETNAAGWDFFLNEGSIANTWYVGVEDGLNGNFLSDPVEVRTSGSCKAGDSNVVKVQFVKNQ